MYNKNYSDNYENYLNQRKVMRDVLDALFGRDGYMARVKEDRASKEQPQQKEAKEKPATDYVTDNTLVKFEKDGSELWCWYAEGNYLPILDNDMDNIGDFDEWEIAAIYKYPISKLNELFWNGYPDEEGLDHPVWIKKSPNHDIDNEIAELEQRIEALKKQRKS